MASAKKVLVVGPGYLGTRVMEGLATRPGAHQYYIAGRDEDYIRRYTNLFRQYAAGFGERLRVEGISLDVENVDRTAEQIAFLEPDVVFMSAAMQRWWPIRSLPPDKQALLAQVQAGPWLPLDLVLVYELMQAISRSGIRPVVINACYPDVTHPLLATHGLSPDVGIGNLAMSVIGLRWLAAEEHGVPLDQVDVTAVYHHYVHFRGTRTGNPTPAPFYLTIRVGDAELPIVPEGVFEPLATTYKRLSGAQFQHVTAVCALNVLRPVIDETSAITHAPGVAGLPGGYPISIERGKINLFLPDDLELPEAVAINNEGGKFDGIAEIRADGTVRFDDAQVDRLDSALGYRCPVMSLEECRPWAVELLERFRHLANAAGSVSAGATEGSRLSWVGRP